MSAKRCSCNMKNFYGSGWGEAKLHAPTCDFGLVDAEDVRYARHRAFLHVTKNWADGWHRQPEYVNAMLDAVLRVGPSRISARAQPSEPHAAPPAPPRDGGGG